MVNLRTYIKSSQTVCNGAAISLESTWFRLLRVVCSRHNIFQDLRNILGMDVTQRSLIHTKCPLPQNHIGSTPSKGSSQRTKNTIPIAIFKHNFDYVFKYFNAHSFPNRYLDTLSVVGTTRPRGIFLTPFQFFLLRKWKLSKLNFAPCL